MRAEEFRGTTMNPAAEMIAEEQPAKVILERTDGLLDELANELRGIEDAIFSPESRDRMPLIQEPDNCLLDTLKRQNNAAYELLQIAAHIRKGLW